MDHWPTERQWSFGRIQPTPTLESAGRPLEEPRHIEPALAASHESFAGGGGVSPCGLFALSPRMLMR